MTDAAQEKPALARLEMSMTTPAAKKLASLQHAYGWTRGEVVEALLDKADLPTLSTETFHGILTLWAAVESLGLGLAARDDATALAIISALHRIEAQLAAIIAVNDRVAPK
ncbi:MAG: hypothetical protein Q8K20_12350 [Gemmobacter sp.]|jgi:hypothetical protein|nr:hypothetical protein [Gemmobacter sp.]